MKIIEIVGDNYGGTWEKTRIACRGIVIREGKLLLSYEAGTGFWMIPGGGLEAGESECECCIREVAEETGFIIKPSPCALEIDEYYGTRKYISRYFFGTVVGSCERRLTADEARAGMEPRWLLPNEIKAVFSQHADFAGKDEIKRGVYQREYAALCELLKEPSPDAPSGCLFS